MKHPVSRYVFERCLRHSLVGLLVGLWPWLLVAGGGCSLADDQAPGYATGSVEATAVSAEVVVAAPVHRPVLGRWPAAAFNGTQYLVVWEDLRAGRPILYGARVRADGTEFDGAGFEILDVLPEAETFQVYDPAVAFDGENYLVVTEADGQIHGVRVSREGEALETGGFAISTSSSTASRPALAFDGEQYLVAWARQPSPDSADSGVYWARVKPDGTVLDPEGVRGFALGDSSQVAVSFDGTNHLLSWVDLDPETQRHVVVAARIGTDGAPIDTAGFRVSPSDLRANRLVSPVAGFDGTNHVIAWKSTADDDEGYERLTVRVSRVSPQATVLDPDGIEVHGEGVESTEVHRLGITAGNGHSIVTTSIHNDGEGGPSAAFVEVAQVAANGTVTTHPADRFTLGLEATVVEHPAGALLLWRDGDSLDDDATRIMGAQLDTAGTPVTGIPVAPASSASRQEVRGVASDGQTFFVVWSDTRDPASEGKALYGARLMADGTLLDAEGIQLTTDIADVADVVFDGASFLVTWAHHTGGEGDGSPFHSVRVSPDGELLDITPEEPALSSPYDTMAGASDGTHTLLVGDHNDSVSSALAAVLVDQQGAYASEVASIIEKDGLGYSGDIHDVAVSFDGTGYLVVWHHGDEILGQRVSAAGALVGGHLPIVTGQTIYRSTVRFGGGNHLVVWQGSDGLYATRVDPAGQVLDPAGKLIAAVEPMCASPGRCCGRGAAIATGTCHSVAFDGTYFLVAWRAPAHAGGTSALDLHGAQVGTEGQVLRTLTISDEPDREGAPFLASSDYGHVLAAYSRFVPGAPNGARLARARFLTEGSPIPGPDAGPPSPAPDAGGSPVDPLPGDGDGCGCTVGAAQPTPVAPIVLLCGVIGLWLVRRRGAR